MTTTTPARTRLGGSDLEVFPLALGANTFGWTSDEPTSHAVLDAFLAAGGNFVDTADSYSAFADGNSGGESETILGRWFATRPGAREQVVLGTKVSRHPQFRGLAPETVALAANASLTRLGTDHLDLYSAHYDDPDTPLVETLAAFQALVDAGKVRHVGISNYSPARVAEWVRTARENGFDAPVALQPHYNLVTRTEFERDYAPLAREHDLGVTPYFALAAGFLTGKYRTVADLPGSTRGRMAAGYASPEGLAVVDVLAEVAAAHEAEIATVALAWLLAQPTVVAPIASARVVDQLGALTAAPALALTDAELARLTEASDAVPAA